ncbi:MAG: DNA recombination/repair protein RecA, partial [Candidatus Moraniibacteriota bacterium]
FYASVRIDMRKIGNITEGETIVGSRHRAKIVKNKVSPPFKVAEFDMTASGISRSGGVLDVAVENGIIEKSGSFFKYKGEMLAQGREATKTALEEKPDLMKKIEKEIWDKIKTQDATSN